MRAAAAAPQGPQTAHTFPQPPLSMYSSDTARASLLAALMLLFLWPAAQAQSLVTDGAAKGNMRDAPSTFGGSDLLYDQTGSVPSGVVVQYNAGNSDFDALAADDFTIPLGLTWTVDVVASTGFYTGPANTGDCQRANVILWEDMGAGQPDAQLYTFEDITPFFDSAANLAIGTLGVALPQPVVLEAGTYWFSLVCEGDNLDVASGGGRWNWQFNDDIGLGDNAQFRNDGGGFGLPVGWNDYSSLFGGVRNNASFLIFGFESGTALLPELTVEQPELTAMSPPDATTSRVLTLRNTGDDDLTWSIPQFDVPPPVAGGGLPAIRFAGYPSLSAPRGGSVYNRTGMDAFGYTFKDNDEPDGPAYNFTDISGTGTALGLGDDTGSVVALPFPFPFYGDIKTDVGVASNGYLTFGADLTDFSPTPIPQDDAFNPNDLIAPYWDDLNPSDASSDDVYTQDMGDGRFIVQWNEIAPFTSGGADGTTNATFQVVLFDDGSIEFYYGDMNDPNQNASIGIENVDASDGFQIALDEDGYADNGRAIRIELDLSAADFITDATPSSGTLAPGEDVNVTVTFDATGLAVGSYNDMIEIVSNGGDVTVPATLDVVGPPEIFVDPLLLEATLDSGQSETRPITITNTGLEDLEFSFAGYSDATAQAPANFGPRTKISRDKGENGPSNGVQSFGAGGPDAFGYVWVDSNESGGPAVDFQDISGSGVEITPGDWIPTNTAFPGADEGYIDVTLPFAFSFYGEEQTDIRVYSNGFATFSDFVGDSFTNQPIPTADEPNGIIAPLWTDFDLSTGGSAYYGLTPDGRFAIQYEEAPRFLEAEGNTFQIILGENGTIEFQYEALNSPTTDVGTVGIESPAGDDGLQIAFDETYLESSFAILIGQETLLVSDVSPASGVVAPGQSLTVTVTIDADELFAGTYDDDLIIVSNDPVRPTTAVDVLVTVTGNPMVMVDPSMIGFGEVLLGSEGVETVTVTNTGTDVLMIGAITSDNPLFSASTPSSTTVAPGGTATFTVTFTPAQLASSSGTITVSTDAGDRTIAVSGVAAPAPVMSVTPESLTFSVAPGETSDAQTLTIQNDGVGTGTYSATALFSGDLGTVPQTADLQPGAGEGLSTASASATPRIPGESTGVRTFKSGDQVTITHSESQAIEPITGISCPTPPNSHFRVFDLADFDITGDFDVTSVEFGIESMSFDETTEVILYTLDGDFVLDNLTEVARVDAPVGPANDLSIVSFDISAEFSSADVMVVEWFVPTARPFFGGNAAGQSSPTYLQGSGCSIDEPTDIATIPDGAGGTFDANFWVVNVTGTVAASAGDIVQITPASGSIAPAQNEDISVSIDASGLDAGTYDFVIDIETNDPANPVLTVPVTVTVAAGVSNEDGSAVTEFALEASAPNPSAGQTSLRYAVPETSEVLIEVYDLMGRRVATLVDGEQAPGRKTVQWDAGSLAGGVYVYRMTAGSFAQTMKMVVVR